MQSRCFISRRRLRFPSKITSGCEGNLMSMESSTYLAHWSCESALHFHSEMRQPCLLLAEVTSMRVLQLSKRSEARGDHLEKR